MRKCPQNALVPTSDGKIMDKSAMSRTVVDPTKRIIQRSPDYERFKSVQISTGAFASIISLPLRSLNSGSSSASYRPSGYNFVRTADMSGGNGRADGGGHQRGGSARRRRGHRAGSAIDPPPLFTGTMSCAAAGYRARATIEHLVGSESTTALLGQAACPTHQTD